MSDQITRFGQVAKILNYGNSIIIDEKGVEENVEENVKAGWYLGVNGAYQKRITAPWLVDPLVRISLGLRMQIHISIPESAGSKWQLECCVGRNGISGCGKCELPGNGLDWDFAKALHTIKTAALDAQINYSNALPICRKIAKSQPLQMTMATSAQ